MSKTYPFFTSALSKYFFFISKDRKLYARGENSQMQLSVGGSFRNFKPEKVITQKNSEKKFTIVKAISSIDHSIFITKDYRALTVGRNSYGQLALGDHIKRGVATLVTSFGNKKVTDAAAGAKFSIFMVESKLFGSGKAQHGQGCNEAYIYSCNEPVKMMFNEKVIDFCCGLEFTALLSDKNEVYVTGRIVEGYISIPMKISGFLRGDKIIKIAAKENALLALSNNSPKKLKARSKKVMRTKVYGIGYLEGTGIRFAQTLDTLKPREFKCLYDKNIIDIKCGVYKFLALSKYGTAYGLSIRKSHLGIKPSTQKKNGFYVLKENIVQIECSNDRVFLFEGGVVWVGGEKHVLKVSKEINVVERKRFETDEIRYNLAYPNRLKFQIFCDILFV